MKQLLEQMVEKQVVAVVVTRYWLIFLGLLSYCISFSQNDTTAFEIDETQITEIQLLYSFYEQDGDNSAVTGGRGTEYLTDHATAVVVNLPISPNNKLLLDIGVDYITSASTDKIDFNRSSASRHDLRTHASATYSWLPKDANWSYGIKWSGSIESDYISTGFGGFTNYLSDDENQSLYFGVQTYFDNLEWGWLDEERFFTPQFLIYPEEINNINWFDKVHRNTYAFSSTYSRVINRSMNWSLMTDITYQEGLLSTPFHRVYFRNGAAPYVETLPFKRWKFALGSRLNAYLFDQLILRTYARIYKDDFGIEALTLSVETPIKWSSAFSIHPFFRWYIQDGSPYFQEIYQHDKFSTFFTSDFDYSSFYSLKYGAGFRYSPFISFWNNKLSWQSLEARMAFYNRSDGLRAYIFSLSANFKFYKRKKKS